MYEHWGGTKPSETPYGDVRIGGKVPKELYYDASKDSFASSQDLKKITISARSMNFVPIEVSGENKNRKLQWWWKSDSDLEFGVRLSPSGESKKAEEDSDILIWPKWKLWTQHVPETRTVCSIYIFNIVNLEIFRFRFQRVDYINWSLIILTVNYGARQ